MGGFGSLGFLVHGNFLKRNRNLNSVRVVFHNYFLRNVCKKSCFSVGKSFSYKAAVRASNDSATLPPEVDLFSEQVKPDEYTVLGLAFCFQRDSNGKLQELVVIEPVPTSTLETILQGVPTSYKRLVATVYSRAMDISSIPPAFVEDERVSFCENYSERLQAATRTYRARLEAKKIQLGEVYVTINFSTSPKRVLNEKFEPSFEDNVKQDISIDVYGRKKDEEVKSEIEKLYNA
ncbi:uncharacterized protein Gasu_30230 [Galdieria sulphuraria]|uniref:Uncharacterized protein n=1 Tax=Galdieria sulphuraria TaxID=130081 RepID=M2Y193_GALSU|nr:uncharacterized protein Gasu_30230 [Galdieria sulphuraria]EME29584.1 hypothetical protein Gasu_30230 [Galdieria sulphuraria]|eukprot:XP_005706104.1 hypothetical protein Gasu_30230 [Galdieria sulphuraria]